MTLVRRFLAFANESYGLAPEQVTQIMNRVYLRGDLLVGYFVLGHVVVALLQATAFDTWAITIPVTLAATAMYFSSVALMPGTLFTRFVAGIVLQTFVALHIYQLHGMPEMHFYFFTAQTMLIVYEDWRATWPGTWLIIGQHILFALLQNTGSTLYFFPDSYVTVRKLAFHFGIALVQVTICSYWSIRQRRSRLLALWQQKEIETSRAQAVATARLSALGQMAAGLAHEVNNPLAVIGSSARNLVRMTQRGELEASGILKHADRITQTADRIAKIVKSLRHIARDGSRDDFETIQVSEIMENCLELCADKFRTHGVRLIQPEIDPALMIHCREAQIGEVLLNLLQNAFDAVVDLPGEKWVSVEATAWDGSIAIAVSDNGPGVPPELRHRIMEPFFTTKAAGKGTGLGLSLSKSIAEAHSGTLELCSEPGDTCFILTLPLSQVPAPQRELALR